MALLELFYPTGRRGSELVGLPMSTLAPDRSTVANSCVWVVPGSHLWEHERAMEMVERGRRLCADAGVSWLDLSCNAHIVAPGLRILIEGKKNRFVRRGRPSTAFAPRSARIARRLLIEPERAFRQQELARVIGDALS